MLKVRCGSVAGDDAVQVNVVVLEEGPVTEVLHRPHHPVPGPIPLPPPVGHVDIGMRAVVTVAHSSGGKAGAEHNIPK